MKTISLVLAIKKALRKRQTYICPWSVWEKHQLDHESEATCISRIAAQAKADWLVDKDGDARFFEPN